MKSVWTCFHFYGCIYLGVRGLDHMVHLCLIFRRLPNCFPKWLHNFTILPSMCEASTLRRWNPPPTRVIVNPFWLLPFWWVSSLTVVLIYMSLVTNVVTQHLFMWLSANGISLVKCLFRYFAFFKNYIVLLLSSEFFMFILHTNPLSIYYFYNLEIFFASLQFALFIWI